MISAITNTSESASTGAMIHGSAGGERADHAGAQHRPSKVPTPPSMTDRKACTRKRMPMSAESENSGTISAPARPASAAPKAKVAA